MYKKRKRTLQIKERVNNYYFFKKKYSSSSLTLEQSALSLCNKKKTILGNKNHHIVMIKNTLMGNKWNILNILQHMTFDFSTPITIL